ncbi:hypothetical protein K1719_021014 [Acacia pycnantha]|nr:hypothetical protein K1719_021014 [Acacia pycnantha]
MEAEQAALGAKKRGVEGDRRYQGTRMRKWGKWVDEIREPNMCSRIWLWSYSTLVATARAYDTVVFYIRGPSDRLNFPDLLAEEGCLAIVGDFSAPSIRKKAIEVGTRVDAFYSDQHHASAEALELMPCGIGVSLVDSNKMPELENLKCNCGGR